MIYNQSTKSRDEVMSMGIAKYEEDIREAIDERMRDNGRYYYGHTYINRYPDYPSKKQPINNCNITPMSTSTINTCDSKQLGMHATNTIGVTAKNTIPRKKKIGYVIRNYEHYGIEIYFYHRPSESILGKLKDNGWHWHNKKKCWFRKYSLSNQSFAEKIIVQ